jgi:uncharacterized protein YciI
MLTTALCVLAMTNQDKLPAVQMGKAQLCYLVRSKSAPKLSTSKWEKMKVGHLKFLETLWGSRKVLFVGYPMEPRTKIDDIVLVDVESPEAAKELLKADPSVLAGDLEIETHTWFFAKNYVTKGAEFSDFKRYWFGTLDRPDAELPKLSDEEGQKLQDGHMANIIKMAGEGALLIAGPMVEPTNFRGIFIFRDMPKEKIDEMTAVDPLIKAGRLKLTLFKMLAPKGSFISEKS